jgi:hypothetical protein
LIFYDHNPTLKIKNVCKLFANRLHLKKKIKKGMLTLICIPFTVLGFTPAPPAGLEPATL